MRGSCALSKAINLLEHGFEGLVSGGVAKISASRKKSGSKEWAMTFWKVDVLNADSSHKGLTGFGIVVTRSLFFSLSDGIMRTHSLPEVQIPDVVVDAARRQAQA